MGSNGGNTLGMTPQSRPVAVLVTRPAGQGDRFSAALQDRFGTDIRTVLSPLLAPAFLTPEWPDGPYSCLILTSETGVEAAVRLRQTRALPDRAICVGDRTAHVARVHGFDTLSAQGDAEALVSLVLAGSDAGPFLHLRGREARGDIAPRLSAKGKPTRAVVVYEQNPLPLGSEARAVLDGQDSVIVPLFSPRTAEIFAAQGPFAAPLRIAAISAATAERVTALRPEAVAIAERPDAPAMLDAIATLIPAPRA